MCRPRRTTSSHAHSGPAGTDGAIDPEIRASKPVINSTSLAIVAGVLIAWVVSHAFGLGQIIDLIIVGVGAISIGMAVFTGFRGARAPRTGKGPVNVGPAPPPTPGARYRPRVRQDPALPPGHGRTTFWGDITISTHGSATEHALALLHEKVHRFLAPKLYVLRHYRVANRDSSYVYSSLWRY